MQLSQPEVFFYALAGAFVLAYIIMPNLVVKYYMWRYHKWQQGNRLKPLDCAKCMGGWFALILALCSGYGWQSFLMCVAGVFLGAIMEAVIMRYL